MSGNVLTDTPEICFTNLSCISIQSSWQSRLAITVG
jgi:hypothetical protein